MCVTRPCLGCKRISGPMATVDEDHVRRIEDLVSQLDRLPDTEARQVAHSLLEAVLELHGAGLERMMDIVFETGEPGKKAIRQFTQDSLLSSLLLLHNLHPDDLATRVQHVLGKAHGTAELVSTFEGVVKVRLTGGSNCGAKQALELAIRDAAPDATDIVVEDSGTTGGFVPLTSLGAFVPGVF